VKIYSQTRTLINVLGLSSLLKSRCMWDNCLLIQVSH